MGRRIAAGNVPARVLWVSTAMPFDSTAGAAPLLALLATPDGRPGGRWLLDAGHPWLVIAKNIVHAIQVPPAQDWTVVSFHTVPAADLLEVAASGERWYNAGRANR